jgi:hypothetical protein
MVARFLRSMPLSLLGLSLAIAMVAACGGHTLEGKLSLFDTKFGTSIGSCTGEGGYDDIRAGAAVIVKDESGKVLATGSLGSGKITDPATCEFSFSLADVPDAKFYQIEVSHRGALTYSRDDLDKRGWKVEFTLGS